MQTNLKTKRNLRLDRRRQCKRTRFDRTFDQSDQSNVVIPICKPKNGDDAGGTESKGPDCPGRSHAGGKSHTGNRQNLQVKRAPTGYSISGTRTCSRKSSNSSRLTLNYKASIL